MESQDNPTHTEMGNDLQTERSLDAPVPLEAPSDAPPSGARKSAAPLIIGIAIAVALLCGVCLAGVILWRAGVLAILAPKQAAARLMPAGTALFASIDVDIEDTMGYKHLEEVYGDIPEVEDAWDDLLAQMEDEFGISYEDDIKPWLGPEFAMGIANAAGALRGADPIFVVAAGTRDRKASDAFLEKMLDHLEDEGYVVEDETYQRVDYFAAKPENPWETPVILGTVKRFVILTTDKDAMEDVIDAARGKADSLADNERYTELMGALPGDAAAYMVFAIEDLIEAGLQVMREGFERPGPDLPSTATDQLEVFHAVGLAVGLDREGIQFDFAATFDSDALSPEVLESLEAETSANRILKRIPDDALAFLSGQNLAAAWRSAFASLMEVPDVKERLGDLGDQLGLDLNDELLDWLPGEFAVTWLKVRGIDDVPVGGFAVFEVDEREEAENALADIVGAVEELAPLEFDKEDIGEVEMQVVRDPDTGDVVLGYGFIDKHLVIGFTEDALEAAADEDIDAVADDETFRQVRKHLPGKTSGYSYVNVEAALRLARRSVSDHEWEEFDEFATPFLGPIKAMGAAAPPIDSKKGVSRGTLFLYIPGE